MSEPWFYASAEQWESQAVVLSPDETHHATAVLRIGPPDVITVTDGAGTVARCAVASTPGDGRLVAEILEVTRARPRRPEIVVYQGAAKGAKVDGVVERLAELGVAEVWIFASERAVVRWDEHKQLRLSERWRAIAIGAAKQSRNAHVTRTGTMLSWAELLSRIGREPASIVLWEEASLPLRTALDEPVDRVALVVGPEGGLARAEAESLGDVGSQLVSLGPQILRTENAAVAAASMLLYHYGLIG
jgi:16S rRNA (uracil1498-N3)-methyltransferase